MIGPRTRLLAVIGHPVAHSLSPRMHNAAFAADGLDFVYVALDVEPEDLPAAVRGAGALGFRGLNVTMPHKGAMLPLVDELDEAARVSGAVNTVVIGAGGATRGHNTDGGGMVEACREAGTEPESRTALLLGTGGAAAAVALAFAAEGAKEIRLVGRNPATAGELAQKLRGAGAGGVEVYPPDGIGEAVRGAEIVVNATPLGMKDGDPLPVPAERLREGLTVCDAVYRPGEETDLIRAARRRGARAVPGERMLLHQGVLAQKLWTGRDPNVGAMDAAIS